VHELSFDLTHFLSEFTQHCLCGVNRPPWNLWDSVYSVFSTSSDSSDLRLSGCLLFSHCS